MNNNFIDSETKTVDEEKYEEPAVDHRTKKKFLANEQLIYAVIGVALLVMVIVTGWFVFNYGFTLTGS